MGEIVRTLGRRPIDVTMMSIVTEAKWRKYKDVGEFTDVVIKNLLKKEHSPSFDNEKKVLFDLGVRPTSVIPEPFWLKMLDLVYENDGAPTMVLEKGGEDIFRVFNDHQNCWRNSLERSQWVAIYCKQAFECVIKLHALGKSHEDIKPENFVKRFPAESGIRQLSRKNGVALIDFGFTTNFRTPRECNLLWGTAFYRHPRWYREDRNPVSSAVNDLFAMGVTLFVLFASGTICPAESANPAEIYGATQLFLDGSWKPKMLNQRPSVAKLHNFEAFCDLVEKLCTSHWQMATSDILDHPFFLDCDEMHSVLDKEEQKKEIEERSEMAKRLRIY